MYSIRKTTKTTFVYRKKIVKRLYKGGADGGGGGSGWRGRGQRMLSIEDKK